jgi:hypothetical protein
VRLGSPEDYTSLFLPRILAGFADVHPNVQVTLICEPTPRLVSLLTRGNWTSPFSQRRTATTAGPFTLNKLSGLHPKTAQPLKGILFRFPLFVVLSILNQTLSKGRIKWPLHLILVLTPLVDAFVEQFATK